jgi:cytochrome c2
MSPSPRLFVCLLLVALLAPASRALELHPNRQSPTDLAIAGLLAGVPADQTRFLRWADLAKLPSSKLKLTGEFVPGEQEVTVVFLTELWKALPLAPGADALLATCTDGYASVYRDAFIASHRPFLILTINGQGPEKWPPPGLHFNPGPYVISVSADVAPAVASLIDAGHKKPWGVSALRVARYTEAFAGFYTAPRTALSDRALAGRELWIHSCTSCHAGPPATFGGTKSDRAFDVLAAHARFNPTYFKNYIRDPKGFAPSAKMEPHPHYTDAQLDTLIAFLVAEPRP